MTQDRSDIQIVASAVAQQLTAAADELGRLDGAAGDGDLGVTAGRIATVIDEMGSDAAARGIDLGTALRELGLAIAQRAPSTSGTLLATAVLAAGRALGDVGGAHDPVATALAAGMAAIQKRGGAQPGEKTMIDALEPATVAARAQTGCAAAARAAAVASRRGAQETARMNPRHGRASWLADRSAGHPDAGATMVAALIEGLAVGLATLEEQHENR